jgi:hypothetical protein
MGSKGTVTPLSESISVEDAANVAKKVAEAIDVQRQQLQTLETFSDENQSLCKLLLDLPDLVSYNIMVPYHLLHLRISLTYLLETGECGVLSPNCYYQMNCSVKHVCCPAVTISQASKFIF